MVKDSFPVKVSLTSVFDLGLSRLRGRHHGGGGLRHAAGCLLEAPQVATVFVCLHLQRREGEAAWSPLCSRRGGLHPPPSPPAGWRAAVTYLGSGYQLSRAGGDFMGANHQLLELPLALHDQVGRIPAKTQGELESLAADWKHHWRHWQ